MPLVYIIEQSVVSWNINKIEPSLLDVAKKERQQHEHQHKLTQSYYLYVFLYELTFASQVTPM